MVWQLRHCSRFRKRVVCSDPHANAVTAMHKTVHAACSTRRSSYAHIQPAASRPSPGPVVGHKRTQKLPNHLLRPASASAAASWPSKEPNSQHNSSSAYDTTAPVHDSFLLVHPLAKAVAVILLAVRDAANKAAAGTRSAGRRLARLQVWLGKPEALLFREGCQLLACLMFILLYVWSTYSPVLHGGGRWWLDLVLSLLFAADYVHRTLTSSRHPLLAALHPLALIDLLSFAPSLLGALLPDYMAPWGWDLRWFRVFRALRLLRLSLLSGNLSTMKTNRGVLIAGNLNVPLVWLVASVVAWMFTSASCVAVMEKLPWHDALYFVGSTLTTVGYGDVVVKSSIGRLFVLVMMLVGVVLIPVRASQLYSRLSERLLVAGHKAGDAPGCAGGYVVLSGRLSDVRGFNDFLQDFLVQVRHLSAWSTVPGGGRQGLQLVCLCNKPSVEFLALQELHESHLTLVEGSAFSERDLLHRAGLPGSLGAMVLADRFSSNATAEDTDVQFRVWAIKSAVKRLPLYVQVLRRSSVDVISPFLDPYLDVIMSVEGTRMRLLALSSLVPGASTLIANLLRSSGPNAGFAGGPNHGSTASRRMPWASSSGSNGSSPASSFDSQDESAPAFGWQQKLQAAVRSLDDVMISHPYAAHGSNGSSRRVAAAGAAAVAGARTGMLAGRRWLREYADGAHCELFMVPAGPPLAGLRFTDAAQAVYEASGAMVVGVIEPGSQRLRLNPFSHTIHQEQQLVVLASTYKLAQAAAAGAGVEEVLFSQALRAAQEEAAAAAAAAVAAQQAQAAYLQHNGGDNGRSTSLQEDPQQQQEEEARLQVNGQQQQHQAKQSHADALQQPPSVAAVGAVQNIASSSNGVGSSTSSGSLQPSLNGSSSGSSSSGRSLSESRLHGSTSSLDGSSRSATVRVPESLASELARSNAGPGRAGSRVQQRQCAEQQPQLHHWQGSAQQGQQQQQQQLQQSSTPMVAGAVFAEGMHYADAYAAFEQQQSQKAAGAVKPQETGATPAAAAAAAAAAASSAGVAAGVYDGSAVDGDDDLVSGCLAPWSGAFESDSLDETELCTDSEMLEAALLQRQKQQAHAEWLQQQQQQQWLMLSSYDSSSMANQQAAGGVVGVPGSRSGSPQLRPSSLGFQAPGPGLSGDSMGRTAVGQVSGAAGGLPGSRGGSPIQPEVQQTRQALNGDSLGRGPTPGACLQGLQVTQPTQPPSAAAGVSVTSITASALDQHIQQQRQQQPVGGDGSWPPHHQLQQQQLQDGVHGPESLAPPSQLQGHFILAGCASSFVQFARQLAASASPASEPLTVVLLHPEHPGAAITAIRRMGVTVHYVNGRSSDAAALLAAGAKRARSLVYLGPSERPTNLPVMAVSGVYGDPTGSTQAAHADVGSSRTAVLADADALSSCYGVGEVFLPDSLSTIVELGFTSSIRFLQPGLLLHGRPAPHSSGSLDEAPGSDLFPGSQLLGKVVAGVSLTWAKVTGSKGSGSSSTSSPTSSRSSMDGGHKQQQSSQKRQQRGELHSHPLADAFLPTGSPAATRPASPWDQQQQQQHRQQENPAVGERQQQQQVLDRKQQQQEQRRQQRRQRREDNQQQQEQQRLSWPWHQQLQQQPQHSKLPRSSWRHRKEIEEAGQLEGLTEWQLNSYYAAGRVMVPALLDIFTCQGFFRRQALLDLLTELAGDDGRPGGAMLQQQPVPSHLVGCCYHELVAHYLTHPDPLLRYVPIGLLRKKAENRAWRLPYVATHPHPDTLLQATDLVFVIRPQ